MMSRAAAILAVLMALLSQSHGFVPPSTQRIVKSSSQTSKGRPVALKQHEKLLPAFARGNTAPRTHSVACFGFNLPPGKNDNGLQDILVGAASIVGLIVFFASPLGGLFFAALNSMLALAFIAPLVLILAFNTWQFFNTVEGNCPSCGAPIRVLKDGSPSICFSCGSVVQAKGGTIDFAPNVEQFQQDDSPFGGFFGDALGSPSRERPEEKKSQYRRERTIIDVDVEDIEKK